MPRKGQGSGIGLHEKGYRRIWRRGPLYGKLEHRVVMAGMCREYCYYPLNGDGMPHGFDVHHQDFHKTHNCPSNLLLIEHVLHYHADQERRGYNAGVARAVDNGLTNFEEVED